MDRLTTLMNRLGDGFVQTRVRAAVVPAATHVVTTGALGLPGHGSSPYAPLSASTRFATRWGMTIKCPARPFGSMT